MMFILFAMNFSIYLCTVRLIYTSALKKEGQFSEKKSLINSFVTTT